jgi:hypothetical protein
MFVMALTFGLVLPGCSDGTSDETDTGGKTDKPEATDTWSAVTSLSQLNGTWKGSSNKTMTIWEWAGRDETGLSDGEKLYFGDIKVTDTFEVTVTINVAAKIMEMSSIETLTFSGGNIGNPGVWEMIRDRNFSGLTIDNTKHSATKTEIEPTETINETILEGFQINQTGKKLKTALDITKSGSSGSILIKQ